MSEEEFKCAQERYLDALKKEQSVSRNEVVARINEESAQRNERPISLKVKSHTAT